MGVDEAVWAEVRCAHSASNESAASFCKRLGIARSTYYRCRERENWGPRPGTGEGLPADTTADAPGTARRPATASRQKLTKRLYNAIDQELQQLEAMVAGGGSRSVADIERRTRTIMNMIRGTEKVLELDTDRKLPKGRRPRRSRDARDDAERMRQEIADRLERLHAQRQHSAGPDKSGQRQS